MRKKKLQSISVTTVPNGYVLKFDGARNADGYLYFTPEALMEGMYAHILLKHREQMNPSHIHQLVEAAANWKSVEHTQKVINTLQQKMDSHNQKYCRLATMMLQEREDYANLRHEIVRLKTATSDCSQVVKDIIHRILAMYVFKPKTTYKTLGVDSDDAIAEPETEETDETPTDDDREQ